MESDCYCPDEEVILAADRERSLVGLLPRALDGLQEGASFALSVRHRHVRDESTDVSVLASGDNSRQVSQSRLPQNETLRPYLHMRSIARLGQCAGMSPERPSSQVSVPSASRWISAWNCARPDRTPGSS